MVSVCPGCKSSNYGAVVLQYVLGLDAAIPHLALLKELLAHYLLCPYILSKMFFEGFSSTLSVWVEKLLGGWKATC